MKTTNIDLLPPQEMNKKENIFNKIIFNKYQSWQALAWKLNFNQYLNCNFLPIKPRKDI